MKAITTFLLLLVFGLNAQNLQRCATIGSPDNFDYSTIKTPLQENITIPVVVHVLHNQQSGAIQGNNISVEQINSQIERLNTDFGGLNSELDNVPAVFADAVAYNGIGFDFKLAELDPDGQPTSGITRTYTTKEQFRVEIDDAKQSLLDGVNGWPRSTYINIWVVPNLVRTATDGNDYTILGQSTFPDPNIDENLDGIVIWHKNFGDNTGVSIPQITQYWKGRTLVHEMGHFFSLKHIWGEAQGCEFDDSIIDTPIQNWRYFGCQNSIQSSCGSSDMHMNFMDYADDVCMYFFTNGQKERMLQALNNHPTRTDLLTAGEDAFFTCSAKAGNVLSPAEFEICYDGEVEMLSVFNGNSDYNQIWAICEPNGTMLNIYDTEPISFAEYDAGYYGITVINYVAWDKPNIEALFETDIWTVSSFKEALSITGICADIQQFGYPIFTLLDYGSSPKCPAFSTQQIINLNYTLESYANGFYLSTQNQFSSAKLYDIKGQLMKSTDNNNHFEVKQIASGLYIIHLTFSDGSFWVKKVSVQ